MTIKASPHTQAQSTGEATNQGSAIKAPEDVMTSVFRVEPVVPTSDENELPSPPADEEEAKEEQIQQVLQLVLSLPLFLSCNSFIGTKNARRSNGRKFK